MLKLTETARTIFHQALADCSIGPAMARHASVRGSVLHIAEEAIDLKSLRQIRIVAVGKAATPMLDALWKQLPRLPGCDIAGVLIAPEPPPWLPPEFHFFPGGHPSPNEASFQGARTALRLTGEAAKVGETALCIFLISGGSSAMMELPLDPAISLADTAAFHKTLVASGASITEINCVRKHFSAVKGGRLALAANGAPCHSFLVSDVPSGQEDSLGSGPTVPDRSTVSECNEILARYKLLEQFPAAVRKFFESSALAETPKAEQLQAKTTLLLGSDDLARAAAQKAEALGFTPVIDNTCDDWEYRDAAKYLLDRLRTLRREIPRVCLISAGEVGVALPAHSSSDPAAGVGGRNQQFALYAATLLRPEDGPIAVLSAGSDGIDGNSPAAGAVVDENSLANATASSSPPSNPTASEALEAFNAFPFLDRQKQTIMTGPTGNNLRDLRILLAEDG